MAIVKKIVMLFESVFFMSSCKKNSAAETHRKISHVTGDDTLYYETGKFWFKRFKEGNHNLEDNARTGRPRLKVEDDIEEELKKQPKSTVCKVASSLGLNKTPVHRRLRQSGRVPKFGQLVPHDLPVG
uniref:HTH_48 domain-containing protein n=1 Tax=Caenorhabditis tropicalis TaxID=1561998 RepID=A0A1I7T7W3_9PELO